MEFLIQIRINITSQKSTTFDYSSTFQVIYINKDYLECMVHKQHICNNIQICEMAVYTLAHCSMQ